MTHTTMAVRQVGKHTIHVYSGQINLRSTVYFNTTTTTPNFGPSMIRPLQLVCVFLVRGCTMQVGRHLEQPNNGFA